MKIIFLLIIVFEVYSNLVYQTAAQNVEELQQVHNRNIRATRRTKTTNSKNDPCNYTAPLKPNFSSGRRISQAKCLEYIWDLKQRADHLANVTKCIQKRHPGRHTIGGRKTVSGEFPHMGAVGWRAVVGTWIFRCGSSLISSKFLLTAGHCSRVSSRDASVANPVPEIVRLGDKNIVDVYSRGVEPQDAKIKRIINHPKFKPPKKYFDIAIIELEQDVEFSKLVQPACLWTKFNTQELGKKATLTGWGIVETAGKTISPELQAAEVDVINSNKCDGFLKPHCGRLWCGVESHQLCAGKLAGGVDACQGDSGGPLQVKIQIPVTTQGSMHYVIGVTSFGIGCALPNLPGVYTRVSSFIDWIEDVVWRGL
ncbi:unnamed protein product [Leptosia nina]|uniref:Peptidase S1 domain-containing protein n=1 Tax=Leptosia nina TaxID=320188 RepID=A0AAV1J0Y1_9NEOP